ncbi:LysE family translocator [Kurthia gibsonii]|uniref:LysE family translocator n=1 Tax=Kurthia gibsonii TaxID=33946 RepID=UPI0031B6CC15
MQEVWMFAVVALLIVMVPGVDSLLVLKNTILHGRKAGILTMVGIILALIVWTTLAVLGLAAVISKSLYVFLFIKYAGALYLVYLGIQSWRARAQSVTLQEVAILEKQPFKNTMLNCMMQGLTTDLLNPKTLLLYVTLMPQFIQPNQAANIQLIILASVLMIIAIFWLGIVVFIINMIRQWFLQPKIQSAFNKVTALVLVGLGVRIATEKI